MGGMAIVGFCDYLNLTPNFVDVDQYRRLVVRRSHGPRGGRDQRRPVRSRGGGLRIDSGLVALRDRHRRRRRRRRSLRPVRISFRSHDRRRLCDDRAAPHARLRHHARAARRNRGDDAPACLDESGREVSRSDHRRGRARLARDLVAAASARLLHHQRWRRRAGDHLGRARARPEEEARLYSRRGRDRASRGARPARLPRDCGGPIRPPRLRALRRRAQRHRHGDDLRLVHDHRLSPRSRIWASANAARAARSSAAGACASTAISRSTPTAAGCPRIIRGCAECSS